MIPLRESEATRMVGIDTGEQARSGRPADRNIAVGLFERDATSSKPRHVRRLGLRMTAKTFDVAIQVVADDQNDVRLLGAEPLAIRAQHGDRQQAQQGSWVDSQFHGRAFLGRRKVRALIRDAQYGRPQPCP